MVYRFSSYLFNVSDDMNIDFLKCVLNTEHEYWCVAKECHSSNMGRFERIADEIIFISIPRDIPRGVENAKILLSDIERLERSNMDFNIFLNEDFPPFQMGQSFREVYKGFPISKMYREFIVKAIELDSNNLYDYEKLYRELINQLNKNDQQ